MRNAINALQELATTTNSVANNRYPFPLPAHSNPNLPHVRGNECSLPRSSSHPPDMFCWESETESAVKRCSSNAETQTDIPLEYFRQFVLENRRTVMSWLDCNSDLEVCISESKHNSQFTKPPDWLTKPLPPPALWSSHHHRFSAGDVTDRSSQILYQPLPSSRSLKFHPYS